MRYIWFCRCLILRANGDMSLLDMDDGHELELTDSVELFWVTCGKSDDNENLIEEISWLDYGHRGMQVILCPFLQPIMEAFHFYYTLAVSVFLMSDENIFENQLLQVWYPSPGADPFKQDDF